MRSPPLIASLRSLRTRISLLIGVVTTFVLGLFGAYEITELIGRLRTEQARRIDIASHQLGSLLFTPVHDYDRGELVRCLETQLEDPEVEAIVVRDALDDSLLAGLLRDGEGLRPVQPDDELGHLARRTAPIAHGARSRAVGTVTVYFSDELVARQIERSVRGRIATILVVLVVLVVVLGLCISFFFLRPLARLRTSLSRVVSREPDQPPVELDRGDEIGDLARSFVAMREAVRATIDELRRGEDGLRRIVATLPVLLAALDENDTLVEWNAECERVTGYSANEVLGHPRALARLFPEPARLAAFLQGLRRGETLRDLEFPLRCKDGSRRIIAWSTIGAEMPIKSWESWAVGIDITDRLELDAKLRHAQKMDALGQLAGGVAHDFNNMLTAILGAGELIGARLPEKDRSRRYLEVIENGVGRLSELTSKLLAFSRKQAAHVAPTDLHDVVRDTVALLETTLDKRVRIELDLAAENSTVLGDGTQLENVLLNLGINASHAMPEGGTLQFRTKTVDLSAAWCATSPFELVPGEFVELAVSDTGTGIPPEVLPHIFDPFYTTKPQGKGTGLGLSEAHGAMRQHGGAIKVYSEPGKGTCFHLLLPLSDASTSTAPEVEPVPGSGTVLVVDDELVLRETTEALLVDLGYKVLTAENGARAIEVYRTHRDAIDVVLLDMIMPEMNGRDCFRRLRELEPEVRVVLASGFLLDDDLSELTANGLQGYIRKPYRAVDLSRTLHEAMR